MITDSDRPRLFVAIDPPEAVRSALSELPETLRGVAWAPPHQYHLTLRFVGETPADRLDAITAGLASIRVEPFILPVSGLGAFPPDRPPRVLWAGVGHGHPRLHQLRQRVDDALLAAGLADLDVKIFHPHFTLGRCGPGATAGAVEAFLKRHRAFEAPDFRVEAFTLYRSLLRPGGAEHTPLLRVALHCA
ncbi:MAG: RNA 2',3'-cyclic phosphodiesterase [Opitutaceae bacterium]|nr:RNA 2',3'-cyclic phosphodiesterase [Opitutaceae bacterium]